MRKVTLSVILLTVLILLYVMISSYNTGYHNITSHDIKNRLSELGMVKASFIFVSIYALSIRPLIPLPPSLITVAGGLTFGPLPGTLLSVTGATLNASITFLIARLAGKRFVEKLSGQKWEMINNALSGRGFKTILLVRSLPVGPPFDLVSYAAGLMNISFLKHFFATLFGIIPATMVLSFAGGSFNNGRHFVIPGFVFISVFFFLLPRYLKGLAVKS